MGYYLFALGIFVLPTNLFVVRFSGDFDDRKLMGWFSTTTLLSLVLLSLPLTGNELLIIYIVGSITCFITSNAYEGSSEF